MTLFLLALALSMDAFAAALSQGARTSFNPGLGGALRVGLAFGFAQAIMPFLGWSLGIAFASLIQQFAHWVTFILLLIIGSHMAYEGLTHREEHQERAPIATGWPLFILAVATSIDAAAAGVTIALLGQPVLVACAVIGVVTLVVSAAGVIIGKMVGDFVGQRAEVLGGLVLIGIGTKVLMDHFYAAG